MPSTTFAGLENTPLDKAGVVILPAAYEGTATYGKGTALGPQAILDASYHMELFDEELKTEPFDAGLHTLPLLTLDGQKPEFAIEAVRSALAPHVQAGRKVFTLGGEHSLSLGAVQALKEKYDSFTLLHFDAHPDLRDEWEGSRYSHACWARRASELGVKLVQVGLRAASTDDDAFTRSQGSNIRTFHMHDKAHWKGADVVQYANGNVYVSFDVDALDSGLMPSTGTPEPGGLSWWDALDILRTVSRQSNIIGMDVMELAPIPGMHAPSFTAARLAYKMIAYAFGANQATNY